MWVRGSCSCQSETWKNIDAIIDDNRGLLIEPRSGPTAAGIQPRQGWETSLNIKNLFDQHNIDWMDDSDYGALFSDPRFRIREPCSGRAQ